MIVNMLTDVELHEVSLVKRGANQGAILSLAKTYDKEEKQMEELQKQIQELTDRNVELAKELEEAKASIEPIVDAPIEKENLDPRVLKAIEDGELHRKEAEAVRKELEEFKVAQFVKELENTVDQFSAIFKDANEKKEAVEVLKNVDKTALDFFVEKIAKSAQIIEEGAKVISTEIGKNSDDVSVVDQVQAEAEALVKSENITIEKARTKVYTKLSAEEKKQYDKGVK